MEPASKFIPIGAIVALVALVIGAAGPAVAAAPVAEEDPQKQRSLILANKVVTGDFDKMLESRAIRVLLPHSRTLYFNDRGRERGVTGDTVRDFERFLNKKYARQLHRRPLTIFIIPHTRDILLSDVAAGLGEIAAGDITVTGERLKLVDFVAPVEIPDAAEVLVTGAASPPIGVIDDLAGKTVHVRRATSYYDSLVALNKRLQDEQKPPVQIVLVPDALEDEDLLEMLNAGIFQYLVVDDWLARIWAQVLPRITVRNDIVLHSRGRIGWAIRKESPLLAAEIRDFCKSYLDRQGIVKSRLAHYHQRIKKIKDPTGTAEWKRFEKTIALFQKYGSRYGFDPIMLAAQGYQESTLDQSKRSPAGAVGIMQIMPPTGMAMKVGDIHLAEPNVHAGAKYMDTLMTKYFQDAAFSEQDHALFAFASYNAGPGNIARMRKLAQKRGLDPNRWFNSVELVTAEKIGFETTTYVRNIYKYYVAYKMTERIMAEKTKLREQVTPEKTP